MISIIRYTLITALRDLLFIGLLAVVVIAMMVSSFLGNTALSEQGQMAIAYMAGSTRIITIVGIILFICFHVRRSFDNKEIEMILSRPISRVNFILAYWMAFALLSVVITVSLVILMWGFAYADFTGLLYWGTSIMLEGLMMVAFAMLASLIFNSAVTSALSSLSFYFICRMMGYFATGIMIRPTTYLPDIKHLHTWLSELILMFTSILLPRLDLFAKSSWLIYGVTDVEDWFIVPIQSMIYIPLLLLMAIFDFRRKQF